MRILIVTHLCFPEPDLKGFPFAKQLVKEGHEVQILTGYPNYPEGKLYKGYKRKLVSKENVEGVSIIRFLSFIDHSESHFKRIIAYMSFAIFGSFWGLFATRKADIVYVNMTPAPAALPALVIKLFRRTPVVLDIQDLWPETVYHLGIFRNKFIISLIAYICKKFYQWSNHVVVPSKGLYELMLQTKRVSASKLSVIYNWSSDIQSAAKDPFEIRQSVGFDRFTILYAGNIGIGQGLKVVLDAAEILSNEKILFALIGGGVEKETLKKMKIEKSLSNVIFLPRVPVNEVGEILNSSDALLVHLKKSELFEIMIPGKTQAYLKMGKPILIGVDGEAAGFVENISAGVSFEAENPISLAEKAVKLSKLGKNKLQEMGKNGSDFYHKNLAIEIGTQNFLKLFNAISS